MKKAYKKGKSVLKKYAFPMDNLYEKEIDSILVATEA